MKKGGTESEENRDRNINKKKGKTKKLHYLRRVSKEHQEKESERRERERK